jgi:hypothetical protein
MPTIGIRRPKRKFRVDRPEIEVAAASPKTSQSHREGSGLARMSINPVRAGWAQLRDR